MFHQQYILTAQRTTEVALTDNNDRKQALIHYFYLGRVCLNEI